MEGHWPWPTTSPKCIFWKNLFLPASRSAAAPAGIEKKVRLLPVISLRVSGSRGYFFHRGEEMNQPDIIPAPNPTKTVVIIPQSLIKDHKLTAHQAGFLS